MTAPRQRRAPLEERVVTAVKKMILGTGSGRVLSAAPARFQRAGALGSTASTGHNHMGLGADSTILSGLSDSVLPTAGGDETVAAGVGASAFAYQDIVIGPYSTDVSENWGQSVILGAHNTIYGGPNVILAQGLTFGDQTSGNDSGACVVILGGSGNERPGYDWFSDTWYGVASSVLIGAQYSFLNPPNGGDNGDFLTELNGIYEVLNIVSVEGGTAVWGNNILNVNASEYTFDNFVLGQDLISIGPNWVARETGPFDGSQVYDPHMHKSFAIGFGNFVSGNESSVIGYNGSTERTAHMLLYAGDGAAITLGSLMEFSHDETSIDVGFGSPYPAALSSGSTNGTILCFRPSDSDVTFTLDDIFVPTFGGGNYTQGNYPDGNEYLTGQAMGTYYVIKKTDSGAHKVIVTPQSGTLDGAANIQLTNQWDYVEVLAVRSRTNDSGTFTYAYTWTVLSGRVGGVPIGGSGGGSGAVATDVIWDTKGDLAAGTGADTASKLAAGSNYQILVPDSAQSTGLKWFTPSYADVYRNSVQNLTSGGFTQVNYDTVSNQSADNPWDNTNHNFKCPIAGRYLITAVVGFNPAVALTATAALSLFVNGSEQKRGLQVQTGTWSSFVGSFQYTAVANDTLDIRVFHAQGVNVPVATGAGIIHAEFVYIGPT